MRLWLSMLIQAEFWLPTEKGCTNTKSCGSPIQTAAADFSAYKITNCPKHRRQMVFIHLSRSPDLRIISACTSLLSFPMTDFRPCRHLHAYSGGTVPDLHRIHYSPPTPFRLSAALKCVISCFSEQNITVLWFCQGDFPTGTMVGSQMCEWLDI